MAKKYPVIVQIMLGLVIGGVGVLLFAPTKDQPPPAPVTAADTAPEEDVSGDVTGYVCDQLAAEKMINLGIDGGVIERIAMFENVPTVFMSSDVWASADLSVRLGIVSALECAMAGPDQRLLVVAVRSSGGDLLAEWNGATRKLDLK